jgi:hypothetical protein
MNCVVNVFLAASLLALFACEQTKSGRSPTDTTSQAETQVPISEPTSEPTPAPTPEDSRSPEERQRSINAERTAIDSTFQAQPIDVEWARRVEGKLAAAFADRKDGVILSSAECRKTLCRIQITGLNDVSASVAGTVKTRLGSAVEEEDGYFGGYSTATYSNESDPETTFYVSRNHYKLPNSAGVVEELPRTKQPSPSQ